MKVLQLNIWGGRLMNQIIDLIKNENPDIVCLQEVYNVTGEDIAVVGAVQDILNALPGYTYYFSPVYTMQLMHRKAGFGNCILSKVPIEKSETYFTNGEHVDDFDFDEHDYNNRNFQHVIVAYEGKDLHIINHHGYHIEGHKNGDNESLRQCKQIADFITSLNGKIIATGDFNLAPHSESLEQINKVLTNQCIDHNIATTRTHLTHKTEVCDYIFTSKDIEIRDFKVLDDVASDHCALVATF